MKILYNTQDGRIFYTVYDVDFFKFTHTTNIPLETFEIDEIDPENKNICIDLVRTKGKTDIDGDNKYYIINNELQENEGWEEHYEEI